MVVIMEALIKMCGLKTKFAVFHSQSFDLCIRVLQYIGISSNFQYLMHIAINDYDTGISCILKIA